MAANKVSTESQPSASKRKITEDPGGAVPVAKKAKIPESEAQQTQKYLHTVRDMFPTGEETYLQQCCDQFGEVDIGELISHLLDTPDKPQRAPQVHVACQHIKEKEDRSLKNMYEEAKAKGELLACGSCFAVEFLPEDMAACEDRHILCKECIKKGAEVEIGKGKTELPCLIDCGHMISLQKLKGILQPSVFIRLDQRIQIEEVKAAGIDRSERKNAEAVQCNAEVVRYNAEAVQCNAEAVQCNAEVVRCNVEAVQCNAEDARRNAEAARRNTEAAGRNAETDRRNAKTIRRNAKTIRRNAETIRCNLETIRRNVETIRRNVETIRRNAEAIQRNAEAIQRNAETIRRHAETIRRHAETYHVGCCLM